MYPSSICCYCSFSLVAEIILSPYSSYVNHGTLDNRLGWLDNCSLYYFHKNISLNLPKLQRYAVIKKKQMIKQSPASTKTTKTPIQVLPALRCPSLPPVPLLPRPRRMSRRRISLENPMSCLLAKIHAFDTLTVQPIPHRAEARTR